jgi:hypothetical protein
MEALFSTATLQRPEVKALVPIVPVAVDMHHHLKIIHIH